MCFSGIVYSMVYPVLYMYITKYGCVFLKLGESIILLGSLPLAHNAQHSLVIIVRPTILAPGWPRATGKRRRPDQESSQSI